MGIIIYLVDKKELETKEINDLKLGDAFLIGASQIFALIPGFSRSGTTITAGRILNLKRDESAKFSFYLSAPIVLGAIVLMLFKENTITIITTNLSVFLTGILVSFVVGLVTIKYLLKYLKKHHFKVFMWYRILMAVIILISLFF